MDTGIVGLPRSGKTTIFNAVTRGEAAVTMQVGPQAKPNLGVARVPDPRLDGLKPIYGAERTVAAEINYVDLPAAPEGLGKTRGISGEFLNHLQRADALLVVARAFEDPSVPHVEESLDPLRDLETMLYELAFADLEIIARRLDRVAQGSKGAKPAEREALGREQALLARLKDGLDAGAAVRDQLLDQAEARMLEGFQFLTSKALLVVVNVGESQLPDLEALEERLSNDYSGRLVRSAALCGKLEMELAQMELVEEREFRQSMDLGESGLSRTIRLSHDALDMITFFTGNAKEVRAWTIARGTTALKAAGRIHTDIERGFIRAEVVGHDDMMRCGGLVEAKRQGVLRQEGKGYVVQDGDVINVLFNV